MRSPLTQNLANEGNAALILKSTPIRERQRSPDEGSLAVQAELLHARTISAILVACVALCVTFVNSITTGESAESDEFASVAKSRLRSLLLRLKVISSSHLTSWSLDAPRYKSVQRDTDKTFWLRPVHLCVSVDSDCVCSRCIAGFDLPGLCDRRRSTCTVSPGR